MNPGLPEWAESGAQPAVDCGMDSRADCRTLGRMEHPVSPLSTAAPIDPAWVRKLRYRFDDFEATTRRTGLACSLKLRTQQGCFDRLSSPHAYASIDRLVRESGAAGRWVESHSNGPEVLIYLTPVDNGLAVTREVVELLAGLANARSAGIRGGDADHSSLDLIARYFDTTGDYVEKRILEIAGGAGVEVTDVGAAFAVHGFAVGEGKPQR